MRLILLSFFMINSILSANNIERFNINVGESYKINLNSFSKGSITKYSNLKTNLNKEYIFTNKRSFRENSEDLFLLSDSINAPEAFSIDFKGDIISTTIKCIKIQKEETIKKEETCAIRKQLESSIIEFKREKFSLECMKEVIILK